MNWLRVKNRRIIERYSNIYNGLLKFYSLPEREYAFCIRIFLKYKEELTVWAKENCPETYIPDPKIPLEGLTNEQLVASIYEVGPAWKEFLDIVKIVNQELPGVIPYWERS